MHTRFTDEDEIDTMEKRRKIEKKREQ